MRRAAAVLCLAAVAAGCAPKRLSLPSGRGEPAPDGPEVLAQATSACRAIRTLTAEAALSGSVDGQRLRGRLLLGVAAPASARVEAVAPFGAPLFIFTAVGRDATLLLPRDDRVLERGRPADVLAAVAGVPLSAEELRFTVTGCWSDNTIRRAQQFGANWREIDASADVTLYLRRDKDQDPWRLVAVRHSAPGAGAWTAEYRDFPSDLPATVRIVSDDRSSSASYDLRLSLTQVETNVPLGPEVFRVEVPASARPITIEELRHARPGVRED